MCFHNNHLSCFWDSQFYLIFKRIRQCLFSINPSCRPSSGTRHICFLLYLIHENITLMTNRTMLMANVNSVKWVQNWRLAGVKLIWNTFTLSTYFWLSRVSVTCDKRKITTAIWVSLCEILSTIYGSGNNYQGVLGVGRCVNDVILIFNHV